MSFNGWRLIQNLACLLSLASARGSCSRSFYSHKSQKTWTGRGRHNAKQDWPREANHFQLASPTQLSTHRGSMETLRSRMNKRSDVFVPCFVTFEQLKLFNSCPRVHACSEKFVKYILRSFRVKFGIIRDNAKYKTNPRLASISFVELGKIN